MAALGVPTTICASMMSGTRCQFALDQCYRLHLTGTLARGRAISARAKFASQKGEGLVKPRIVALVTGALHFIAIGMPLQAGADEPRQLVISRTAKAVGSGVSTTVKIEARAQLRDGKLIGNGTVEATQSFSGVVEQAHQPVPFEGTYETAPDGTGLQVRFRVPLKLLYTVTQAPPLTGSETCSNSFCVGVQREFDYSSLDFLAEFSANIVGDVFEARSAAAPNEIPIDIVTRLELTGGESKGEIALIPEHPLIPGFQSIPNAIEVVLPDLPALKESAPFTVRVSLGAGGYGGLAETRDAAVAGKGAREIEIKDAAAGSHHTLYYGWRGELIPDFKETVKAEIPGKDIAGAASFDVGFGVAVTGFGPFTTKEPKTREVQPFRITVARSPEKQPSIEALADKFDLEFQLDLKRTNFQPATSIEQLISELSFNAGDWVEALAQQGASLDAAETGKSPGSLYGDGLLWRVGADGRLWDPKETSPDQRVPNYLPFQRGLHMFTAKVSSIAHGTERLANPTPKGLGYSLNVEMKTATQAFFDQLVLGCASEITQAVAEEIKELKELNPTALAGIEIDAVQLLWACIKVGLDTELADQILSQHILLNTLVMAALQTEQDVQQLMQTVEDVMHPTLEKMPERRVLLLKSPQQPISIEANGRELEPAKSLGDEVAAARAAKSSRAKAAEVERARLQSKGALTGFYADSNETVAIELPAAAEGARLFVVTDKGARELTPTKDPATGHLIFDAAAAREDASKEKSSQTSHDAANGGSNAVAEASEHPKLGGRCTYSSHPGTCTITTVTKTAASSAQAKIDDGRATRAARSRSPLPAARP